MTGSVFLGSVETKGRTSRLEHREEPELEADDEYERPLLSVDCSGLMGSVEIKLP